MDLGALVQLENLNEIMHQHNISIPRLRGLRLMSEEKPLTKEEIKQIELDMIRLVYENGICAYPRWNLSSGISHYSYWTKYLKKYYLDENGDLRWDRVHGKNRKNMKFAIKKKKRDVHQQYAIWNKYAGQDNILYIHARIGGNNWRYYDGCFLEKEPWFLEKVDDCFDNTYCDIYAKICNNRLSGENNG